MYKYCCKLAVVILVFITLLDFEVERHIRLRTLWRSHAIMLQGRPSACLKHVCEEDSLAQRLATAVSSHHRTSLDIWDWGTLTLRSPSCSKGTLGLKPCSWMTWKHPAPFRLWWCFTEEKNILQDKCRRNLQ